MVSGFALMGVRRRGLALGLVSLAIASGFGGLAEAGQTIVQYDALGRATQVTYPGSVVITYDYDALGNRTSYSVSGSPNAPPGGTPPAGGLASPPRPPGTIEAPGRRVPEAGP
jgi:YD repeat-containing protein